MIVKVNWSGGKDSTCAVLEHIKVGNHVKAVCYIPMFTNNIPLINKKHFEFIHNAANYFRSQGAEVFIVDGITYYDYVTRLAKSGKNKGKIMGFPYVGRGRCGFKRDSKLKALQNTNIGFYDYEDIGIAFDEWSRRSQLTKFKRSILVAHGITEYRAKEICLENNLYSPQYENSKRDGCVLCPYVKDVEIEQWLQDYPEAKPILIELQEIVKEKRPDRDPPRIGFKWFI